MAAAHKGTLLLTAAQLWHAVSGYLIFVTGARMLGRESFDDFALVIWTMTTLEIFVVDGVPRAVSWWTARVPEAALGIARKGFLLTLGMAVVLAAILVGAAPIVTGIWNEPGLIRSVRLSAIDFVAFAGFAVLVQSVNGLQRFNAQAGIWLLYSTSKVLAVTGFLKLGWGIEGAVLGYVVGSLFGSLAASVIATPMIASLRGRDMPDVKRLTTFGLPVASWSFALMALVNVDLWAARHSTGDEASVGDYAAAATLARALFFVFKAFGDALFPAVAAAHARGDGNEAARVARKGLTQLCVLLIPLCGCAMGAAGPVLVAIYDDAAWGHGAGFMRWLAPSSVLWTFTAVFASLVAAASRPGRVATLLGGILAFATTMVFAWAAFAGPEGAAMGSLAAAGVGCGGLGVLAVRALGPIIPWRAVTTGVLAAAIIDRALVLWSPDGWWVFGWGGVLWGLVVGGLWRTLVSQRSREATAP